MHTLAGRSCLACLTLCIRRTIGHTSQWVLRPFSMPSHALHEGLGVTSPMQCECSVHACKPLGATVVACACLSPALRHPEAAALAQAGSSVGFPLAKSISR